jgi:ferredoxin
MTLRITPEKSLLDTLLDANVGVKFSCMEGICGSCRVAVQEGLPDHRDHVLTEAERVRNDAVLVCCCGSRAPIPGMALDAGPVTSLHHLKPFKLSTALMVVHKHC